MMTHNIDETNDGTNTASSESPTQNDDSSSVNAEERSESTLQIMSSGQGDVDSIFESLVGEKNENIEEIMKLYSDHAKSFSSSSSLTESKKRNVQITKTDCKAFVRIKLNATGGLYEVVEHILEHNHPLTRPELSYMHRSNRAITDENAIVIEEMMSSGMRPTDVYRYMAQEAGDEDMIDYTKKDHLNFAHRLKILAIEGGDTQGLLNILENQSAEHEDFFYRVRLDEDRRLSHVFWRDSMMKDDFLIFGDVMVFDATYGTNKYNLICAPFVGLNNHKNNVMFGCAFLSNEKIDTFVWLFETFKKYMGGKSPISLFTDQDLAMSKAIEKVFP
ncbi:protein FAR1-RELATED SEQUENCE 5-like [Salvia miltiorrhiza]|uniref:protein FAR1-RELATED SEQUENCE 5-like n=1 Tax=Salvia miltiorrhiza TaxID=226208 RepID=UPI0025AC237D|nr:protein FAR1-RELATED SEQUENCE 5-like [Salvia miltiorrhiza]